MDPAHVTSTLGLQPTHSSRCGEVRRTPKGTPLAGVYTDSRWSGGLCDLSGMTVDRAIAAFLDKVGARTAFWGAIVKGKGEAQFIASLDGRHYQGMTIDVDLLRRLAELEISLGLEIYADEQNS